MAKTVKHGVDGSVTWSSDTTVQEGVRGWVLDVVCDTIDDTSIESTANWKEFTASFKSGTAKVDIINAGSKMTAVGATSLLKLDDGNKTYKMSAICTGIGKTLNYKDVVATTYNFENKATITMSTS